MNLLESYKGRLSISESYYAQTHNGAKMSNDKKLVTAMCLNNTAKFINEAFDNAVGTQRSDLGTFKRFCMDITSVTVPNLVVSDIFLTKPMSSFTGYITYMQFALGTPKGGVGGRDADGNLNTIVANPFMYGASTAERERYTSDRVVEAITSFTSGTTKVAWTPVNTAAGFKLFDASGAEVEGTIAADGTITSTSTVAKAAYVYDNVVVPQKSLPTLVDEMKGITLEAKARRIAIQYSQIAAFQSKQDYGIDFESSIAQQAQAELQFEIDTEAVTLVKEAADNAVTEAETVYWNDIEPNAISYSMKAEGFARAIEQAKANIYKKNRKFAPNWMLVSPDIMPILSFVPGFKGTENAVFANGAYVAGTVNGLKVIVSPALISDGTEHACYLGVLGNDGKTGVGVFAPYMPLVPTQLLGFADGMMSQGFSSMYDMKILNDGLLGKIVVKKNSFDPADTYLGAVNVVESSELVPTV